MTSVNSQVVFITGGGHGIGAEVARRLHAKGAKLVLTDLDAAALAERSAELGGDEHVLTVVADVRDLAAMQAAAAKAVETFGGIDTVIANAGIASYGSVLHVDPEAVKRVLDVNLLGVFHTVRAALPSIIERRGYVLVVSSLAAFTAAPGMAPYDMSKAGNEHLANALRLEVAHLGVAVGSAHMSWIDTALVRDTQKDLPMFREQLAKFPWPLNKTTSVDKLRCGVRRRHRTPQEAGVLPGLGRCVPLVEAVPVDQVRRGPAPQDGRRAGGPDGRRGRRARAVHQRPHPAVGEVLAPSAG